VSARRRIWTGARLALAGGLGVAVAVAIPSLSGAGVPPSQCNPQGTNAYDTTTTVTGTYQGGDGSEFIVGSFLPDNIHAHQGNDLVCAGGGDDTVAGNMGNDQLFGETGNDVLRGRPGIDYLDGGFDIPIPKRRGVIDDDFCGGGKPPGVHGQNDPDFATSTCETVKRASSGGTTAR
jgi:Ca2+-binding RTX toxin-like protein